MLGRRPACSYQQRCAHPGRAPRRPLSGGRHCSFQTGTGSEDPSARVLNSMHLSSAPWGAAEFPFRVPGALYGRDEQRCSSREAGATGCSLHPWRRRPSACPRRRLASTGRDRPRTRRSTSCTVEPGGWRLHIVAMANPSSIMIACRRSLGQRCFSRNYPVWRRGRPPRRHRGRLAVPASAGGVPEPCEPDAGARHDAHSAPRVVSLWTRPRRAPVLPWRHVAVCGE